MIHPLANYFYKTKNPFGYLAVRILLFQKSFI